MKHLPAFSHMLQTGSAAALDVMLSAILTEALKGEL